MRGLYEILLLLLPIALILYFDRGSHLEAICTSVCNGFLHHRIPNCVFLIFLMGN